MRGGVRLTWAAARARIGARPTPTQPPPLRAARLSSLHRRPPQEPAHREVPRLCVVPAGPRQRVLLSRLWRVRVRLSQPLPVALAREAVGLPGR